MSILDQHHDYRVAHLTAAVEALPDDPVLVRHPRPAACDPMPAPSEIVTAP